MPVSHRFSRRAAAIGAALALAALPLTATVTPAFSLPIPTVDASSNPDAEASAGADSTAGSDSTSGDDTDSTADGADGAEADSSSADNGSSDPDPGPDADGDKACKDPDWTSDEPCEIENDLTATWNSDTKELSVKPNNGEPGSLPKSWQNVEFDGPTDRGMVRVPAQDASSNDTADATDSGSDTDDSGQSVAEATMQADAPTRFEFGADGKIRAAGEEEPMKFTGFGDGGPNPEWTFESDGSNIIASGEQYSDNNDGADASGDPDGTSNDGSDTGTDPDGSSDNSLTASDDGTTDDSASADSDTGSGSSADTDGVTADDGSASDAGTDGSSSASDTSDDSTSATDGTTSSDSGSKDRANTSGDRDSDGRESDSDTGSSSDGSRSSDSDSSDSGEDDEKDSDGAGSSAGTSDADDTTPDPSTGNGSPDDERETIPGTAGDEWLPGDDEDAERPDYSDPVPRNPDEQTPKDDTDLITGGDQPSPRANQNPATSFGESIISTIVSSWPIFVLAASGMAAVGFIIYLMGRRGKQD